MASTTGPTLARLKRATPSLARGWAKRRFHAGLARSGFLLARIDDESRKYIQPSHSDDAMLPEGSAAYLRSDNPRLLELQEAYDALDIAATTHTQWRPSFLKKNLSLAWFRGDNAYVWQLRLMGSAAEARTYLSVLDVQSRDKLGLLSKLKEDGLFGAFTFTFGEREPVSRDLLDSVNEIGYLEEHIGLSTLEAPTVLDIGAGYGRLAHRMTTGLPNVARYDCIDGVATSTFLCEYYTGFRKLDRVNVIRLDEWQAMAERYTLAVNVHSFSECSLAAVRWWLGRIAERDIEWLFIVPNTHTELLSTELDGSQQDFLPDVLAAGYELADMRPIYQSDELRELIGLHDHMFLFRKVR